MSGDRDEQSKRALTFREILEDPKLQGDSRMEAMGEAVLAHALTLLLQRGDKEKALRFLEVQSFAIEYDHEYEEYELWLEVLPEQQSAIPREWVKALHNTCAEVSKRLRYRDFNVGLREILPEVGPDWRARLLGELEPPKRPTNQGRKLRQGPPRWSTDYLFFTNEGEQKVYLALKRLQEALPKQETIAVFPLAGGRVLGRTWEPDFLVTYKGRAGVLEVDGPHHNARRALDTSREHLLHEAGVAFVDRVVAEAVHDPIELDSVLSRFLRRLEKS
ncbi:hypothetical protein [Kineosporia babensis]|uniref:DUF559 domain-containing protein n=1 Tax=Kineosporia babensis TaxID=499548 RepID=A0A9X1SW48_9ACTN|nr:hypothetical protein [Kineosporia babensis]MCD5313555.1 hypothetical protein [Kineosporia babensis]